MSHSLPETAGHHFLHPSPPDLPTERSNPAIKHFQQLTRHLATSRQRIRTIRVFSPELSIEGLYVNVSGRTDIHDKRIVTYICAYGDKTVAAGSHICSEGAWDKPISLFSHYKDEGTGARWVVIQEVLPE